MNDLKLFQTAIDEANKALKFDKEKKYQEALKKYLNAVEILNTVKKIQESPDLLVKVEDKIKEYLNRARVLKFSVSKDLGNHSFKKKEFNKELTFFYRPEIEEKKDDDNENPV